MQIGGVVGVAVGRSSSDAEKPCIIVYTTTDERPTELPSSLEGYEVEVHKTTGFRAR
jgi:hypothetical protein